jgi:hypothetical protein
MFEPAIGPIYTAGRGAGWPMSTTMRNYARGAVVVDVGIAIGLAILVW